jgi:ribonuclease HI
MFAACNRVDDVDMTELDEVIALELRLLNPAIRADSDEVERLLHPDFREIGASGRMWDRASMVAALEEEPGSGAQASAVEARMVADGVVLVTYVSESVAGRSRRSSLWVRGDDGWRVLFHTRLATGP